MKYVFNFIICLSLALVLLLTSLDYYSGNETFYKKFQDRNNIAKETGLEVNELNQVNTNLIKYLKTGDNDLLEKHFNIREITHMEDVYKLFELGRTIRLALIIIIVVLFVFTIRKYGFESTFKTSSIMMLLVWVLGGLITALILSDFSESFVKFHHIFFDNDLWLLNPETDMMIRMLPQNFFMEMVYKILIGFVTVLASMHILFLVIFNVIKKERLKNESYSR